MPEIAAATEVGGAPTRVRISRQSRLGRRLRAVPALVWGITVLHVAIMLGYTLVYPVYSNFDESAHTDMVYALVHGDGWPGPGGRIYSQAVIGSDDPYVNGALSQRPYSNDHIWPRGQRPTLQDFGGDKPSAYPVPNQMVQHPPLYYAFAAAVVAPFGVDHWAYDQFVGALRLLNILLLAPLPLIIWATARALRAGWSVATSAAAVPLAIPTLSRVGASVTNDVLLILLTAGTLLALARVMRSELRLRTAVVIGVLTGLAELTKAFGLLLLPAVAASYAVAWWRVRSRRAVAHGLLALGIAVLVGGWWWVRNEILYGAVQPQGLGPVYSRQVLGSPRAGGRSLSDYVSGFTGRIISRFWGSLGLPDPPYLSSTLTGVLTAVLLVGVAAGLVLGIRRSAGHVGEGAAAPAVATRGRRVVLAVLLVPSVLTLVGLFEQAHHSYLTNGVFAGVQGRYLYDGISGVSVVAAVGLARLMGRARAVLPLGTVVGALYVQVRALLAVLGAYWFPVGTHHVVSGLPGAFAGVLRWATWPAGVTWLYAVLVVLASLVTVGLATRMAVTARTSLPGPVGTLG